MPCTRKYFFFFGVVSKERGNKDKMQKKDTRSSHCSHCQVPSKRMELEHKHMSVKCGSREEWKDEKRDEKRGERSGAGGDKCLDSGFRDNSHNGRHPQYTETVKGMKLHSPESHCYIFKCSLMYFTYEETLQQCCLSKKTCI